MSRKESEDKPTFNQDPSALFSADRLPATGFQALATCSGASVGPIPSGCVDKDEQVTCQSDIPAERIGPTRISTDDNDHSIHQADLQHCIGP